jgi:hypothetical protein
MKYHILVGATVAVMLTIAPTNSATQTQRTQFAASATPLLALVAQKKTSRVLSSKKSNSKKTNLPTSYQLRLPRRVD